MPPAAAARTGLAGRTGVLAQWWADAEAKGAALEQHTFEDVSAATWERILATGRTEHGTVFEETAANSGTATTPTPIGAVVLEYAFDPAAERVSYKIVSKPMLAPSGLIWGGIKTTIERCRSA
jgi:hypothetical protein